MTIVRLLAFLYGVLFIGFGVMGYMPEFITDGSLFGRFLVDDMLNKIHIVCGIIGFVAAFNSALARSYFIILGLAFGTAAVLGYVTGEVHGIQMGMDDNLLHAGIAITGLLIGVTQK
jgi:hypothetical protein